MVIDPAALFESAPVPQWVVQGDQVVAANAAARDVFGWNSVSDATPPSALTEDSTRWMKSPGGQDRHVVLQGNAALFRATVAAAPMDDAIHFSASAIGTFRVLDPSFFADESAVAQLLDGLPIAVYVMTAQGVGFYANRQAFDLLGRGLVPSREQLEVYQTFRRGTAEPYPVNEMPIVKALGGTAAWADDMILDRPDGHTPIEVWATPVFGPSGDIEFAIAAFSDITTRRAAEDERAALQDQLVDASRAAGMAQVATSVLHDVGNVLNSVKVSTEQLDRMIQGGSGPHLAKAVALIETHQADLAAFFGRDPRGQRLPAFLDRLAGALSDERASLAEELTSLTARVNHMQTVVSAQQSAATRRDLRLRVDLVELVQGAVAIHQYRLDDLGIEVVWDAPAPVVLETDRHKLMQALINLVGNACDALGEVEGRRLELVCHLHDEEAIIQVRDSGAGVSTANRDRVFQSGFTTKADGHGFGLHSAANVVGELGGALRLLDARPGATFEISLPV